MSAGAPIGGPGAPGGGAVSGDENNDHDNDDDNAAGTRARVGFSRDHLIPAYFRRVDGGVEPLDVSRSEWDPEHLHGVAVSGLLACGAEDALRELGREHFVPTRFHVDLFRPSRMLHTEVRTEVIRTGRRLTLIDVSLVQDGNTTARASALCLAPSENPGGEVWSPTDRPAPPPEHLVGPGGRVGIPFTSSDAPWSDRFEDHQNAGRHTMWHTGIPVVLGESGTTFQQVAGIADTANMVTNWGSGGVGYINTDVSLTLARRPDGVELGLRALDHVQHDGVAVATAEVFDRVGPLGTVSVTAVSNALFAIDFTRDAEAAGATPDD